jgi:hypothetical protein
MRWFVVANRNNNTPFHVCVWCVKHKVSAACWALICQTCYLIKRRSFVVCISRTQLIVNIQIHLPAMLWWATYATAQHRTPIHHTQNKPKKNRRICRCHQNSDPAKTQIPITIIQLHTTWWSVVAGLQREEHTNTEEQTTKIIWLKIAQ